MSVADAQEVFTEEVWREGDSDGVIDHDGSEIFDEAPAGVFVNELGAYIGESIFHDILSDRVGEDCVDTFHDSVASIAFQRLNEYALVALGAAEVLAAL